MFSIVTKLTTSPAASTKHFISFVSDFFECKEQKARTLQIMSSTVEPTTNVKTKESLPKRQQKTTRAPWHFQDHAVLECQYLSQGVVIRSVQLEELDR